MLKENTFVLFENKSSESSKRLEKFGIQYKDLDCEDNSYLKNNIKIIYNNEDNLDMDAFTKLMKIVHDFNNFESHKTLFLYCIHLSL